MPDNSRHTKVNKKIRLNRRVSRKCNFLGVVKDDGVTEKYIVSWRDEEGKEHVSVFVWKANPTMIAASKTMFTSDWYPENNKRFPLTFLTQVRLAINQKKPLRTNITLDDRP